LTCSAIYVTKILTTENLWTTFTRIFCVKIYTKLPSSIHSIILNFGKIMLYLARSPRKFLHFTRHLSSSRITMINDTW